MTSRRLKLSAVIIIGLLLWGTSASAAPSPGISLAPFEQPITIQPTDTTKTFDVVLTNHTSSLQELNLTTHDFGSLNDTGGILFEGNTAYSQKYGLASWVTLGTNTVVLQPGESHSVPVTIDNRGSLQPGGHYGAVVASVNSLNNQTGNHVAINQQLVSLILVDKTGGEHFDLKLAGMTENGNWSRLPTTVKLHFQNPGNVHVIPRGTVQLLSPNGTVISKGIINDDSSFILPETFRDIYVPLTSVKTDVIWPGLYHVQVNYRYEGISHYAVKRFTVRYLDLKLYAGLVLVLLVGIWLFWRFKTKRKRSD
jgi:hypothetical protein